MASASEPDGLAAGAGALPRARRRCEAGKRTHGPGPRACLALLAAAALLALAAPAQAQTEIWSATLTPGDLSGGLLGCNNGISTGECSSTSFLSEDSFTYDSTDYTITVLFLRPDGRFQFQVDADITTATAALTLVVGSTALVLADAPTILSNTRIWNSSGVSLTIGTDITVKLTAPGTPNTAPTVANTIPNQTAMAGTAFSYAFLANTFADTDPGDTLTYTATQSDDTALPSWLSFAAATRTFSGMPTAADVGTVSVKVTASDGHGGSVSDTFDIVVSAAAGVTVSTSALTVTEEDTTGNTYTVVLDSQPTANVTVTVAGHAGTDVTPSPTSLTFTTTTWGTAQTVTVTAGDDADTANDTVTLTHSAASTDSNYGGITIGSVVVTVADNDTANTAPTAANKTVTTGEDRAYAFTADDFGFDDDDAGDTLASVTIVTVPAAGTLALDGTAVLADGVVTKAQIDDSDLTFTPARDAHGAPYTTFTFTVNDGTDDSASAYTMTIDVTDAPVPVCGVPDIAGAGRRQIWTGTVTVERDRVFGVVSYGFDEGHSAGTLLPSQSFFIGSNNYVIDAIAVAISGSMEFSLDGFVQLTDRENAALRLHVCDGDYDFNTADDTTNHHYLVDNPRLVAPGGDPHGVSEPAGEQRRDGRADDYRHGAGRAGADRRREPHHGRRRGALELHLPVGAGGRGRHCRTRRTSPTRPPPPTP